MTAIDQSDCNTISIEITTMPGPSPARPHIQQLHSLRLLPRHRDGSACATNMCKVNTSCQPGKHMLTVATRRPLTVPPRHAVHNLIVMHRSRPTVHGTIHNTVRQDSKCTSLDNLAHTNIQTFDTQTNFQTLIPRARPSSLALSTNT